jgi:pyruvate/2-oxoglutarate dehydrogenase complex dihydrolipoamide acyltransferase (E2) component
MNDEIVIREIMNCVYTVDHRFGDASVGIKYLNIVMDYINDPENFNIDKYPQTPAYNSPDYLKKTK